MKKSKVRAENISRALKQAETGTLLAEVIRRMGISNRRSVAVLHEERPQAFASRQAFNHYGCL